MADTLSPSSERTRCSRRDKPLRTYGRRKQPVSQDEPAIKKRKTVSVPITSDKKPANPQELNADQTHLAKGSGCAESLANSTKLHQEPTAILKASTSSRKVPNSVGRGSILSFFKPVPAKEADSSPRQEREPSAVEQEASPEPSPSSVCRKRSSTGRKLRLRKADTYSLDDPASDQENKPHNHRRKSPEQSEAVHATHNSTIPQTRKPKAQVQTTLDLSTKAAFSECRICDTVWNPLHPEDVKYHNRRHAKVLRRAKARRDDFSSEPV
ncbi:uncharacterized protein J7T54_003011 [Emericellopsis cladophorae]|uniref:N-acetyltransferase ESCO zinc-finger domain-containing protein n=1 Tax=Emericellopsis cladophorae TaxID=2686198 RepID=A0A9Q0BCD4_9HYPO|nr:uncharacterized protein J7T54_003011 [Emericellopsis cladophorae]KAI6780232.1 hypothetical protein J7T54_003011 [Emericellopsis cladophorae]